MTTTTPPGWYPEPGHTGNGPAMERWWDGTAWTEYTRTAPVVIGAPEPSYGYPGYPGYPGGDVIASKGGGGGRRTGAVVIAIVAALVLIGGVVAGALVLGKSGKDDTATGPGPTATVPHRGGGQAPGTEDPREPDDPSQPDNPRSGGDKAVDAYDGISLPVLDGWQGSSNNAGIGASVVTGEYACPGDSTQSCVRGGAFATPGEALKITATSPEAAAKQDISANAANSYSTDIYGPLTSHQELLSESVTVAGQKGYLVRWKIATKSGTGGYIESLVFPSPADSGKLVVVRFGFDIGGKAPGVEVMDEITQGIKADSSGGTDNGAGV
ncbi:MULTISPECIES: DUF2510 domain-containing protein [unclassified Streptomyces]|uniref:DUF2510 domain-containing protein n=1 Tax=unclassified Streptomyces TaxID=2593676 RepID=UPI002E299D05|nr:DUF2510 domain-containing protein [Streptomyces sp. NBC_00223]